MEFRDPYRSRNVAALLLRNLIQERTGIFFADGHVDLMIDKMSPLIAERDGPSLLDYYYRLKYDNDEKEWASVFDAISVRETFFWREFDQIRALVDVVIPGLARDLRGPLKIWSAACASGEEPLTIAMALELAGCFDRIPIEIHASDATDAALVAARLGIYRERCFRSFPMEHRSRFFTPVEKGWKIRPSVHHRIHWHRINLTHECEMNELAETSVIFCRNVFIYFTEATVLKVVRAFERRMERPGHLFLGAAESLLKFDIDLKLREVGGSFVYVKE